MGKVRSSTKSDMGRVRVTHYSTLIGTIEGTGGDGTCKDMKFNFEISVESYLILIGPIKELHRQHLHP